MTFGNVHGGKLSGVMTAVKYKRVLGFAPKDVIIAGMRGFNIHKWQQIIINTTQEMYGKGENLTSSYVQKHHKKHWQAAGFVFGSYSAMINQAKLVDHKGRKLNSENIFCTDKIARAEVKQMVKYHLDNKIEIPHSLRLKAAHFFIESLDDVKEELGIKLKEKSEETYLTSLSKKDRDVERIRTKWAKKPIIVTGVQFPLKDDTPLMPQENTTTEGQTENGN